MDNTNKNQPLRDLMSTCIEKVHSMVDTNTIVGEPIVTPDGSTLIPISKVSFGFGSGGATYGKNTDNFGGGGGAGVKIDPVAFLLIKDGTTKMIPVSSAPLTTVDRIIDMAPGMVDKVEGFIANHRLSKED